MTARNYHDRSQQPPSAAEFILYKLKEMGKISQEDMTPIMEEFETPSVPVLSGTNWTFVTRTKRQKKWGPC
ncbi:hypothetical protein HanPI659440_Chr03g0132471 [Helianthus annuus]|nr:hypothetical protein HanPI659440_Chr03g0132471 [Helianthus annuus]